MDMVYEWMQTRAQLTQNIRALMDKYQDGTEMSAEDKGSMEKMEAEFDKLQAKITAEQRQLERERAAGEKPHQAQGNTDAKTEERMKAFAALLVDGSPQAMQVYAALQMDKPTQAGFLVAPEQFVSEMIAELNDETFMRKKARVLPMLAGAQSLGYPVRTQKMSSFTWGTELSTPTPDTSLEFGKREFKPRPGSSEILISNTLIRNVANADALVRGEMAQEVAEALESAYMTGSGANCPLGLFTASDDGIPTSRDVSKGNTETAITFDGMMETQYSIKQAYQPRCEWVFHRDAVKRLRMLKNSDGQYIWQPSVQLGQPDMLLSKPVNMSEYAPNTFTAGRYVGLYGDLKQYWICDSKAMEIRVLNELYARSNQVSYLMRLETDGAPVMPAAFARVKLA